MLDELKAITTKIGDTIALSVDSSNPAEITGKLQELTCLLANSSHSVALAEMVYSEKLQQLAEDAQWSKLTATDKKNIFAGRLKTEAYYVNLTDRLNRALVHSIEGLRSMLSYLKAEMENLPTN
jgi:hypothetical protein